MKTRFLLIGSFVLLSLFAMACGSQATPTVGTGAAGMPTIPVVDVSSLTEALRAAGVTIAQGGPVEQSFFEVPGEILNINGADIQVFEFQTAEALEAAAAQVAEDGGSIGTNMVTWVESPHFYKAGRALVLYVGEDQTIRDLLEGVLGPQFAGR